MFNRVYLAHALLSWPRWLRGHMRLLLAGSVFALGGQLAWGQAAVTSVAPSSDPGSDNTYAIGDNIDISVRFNANVTVSGAPVLALQVGAATRNAALSATSTQALVFRYQVQAGDLDADGIGVTTNALTGGTILDSASNPVNRSFSAVGILTWNGHRVDGVVPEVSSVEIGSNAGSDNTYAKGNNIDIRVRFSERVYVTHNPDLRLEITIGAVGRRAYLSSRDGSNTLTFRYRVQDNDEDNNGISIAAGALTGGNVADVAGNNWNTALLPTLADQEQHRVDGAAPTATVAFTSDAGTDGTYVQGDPIELEVTFDEPVTVRGTPALLLTFEDPSVDTDRPEPLRRATITRTRPTVLTFHYVVVAGDLDANGISVGAQALVDGTIRDAAGNLADRSLAPLTDNTAHRVDAVAPEPTNVAVSSSPLNSDTYRTGETIEVSVTFNENVYVTGGLELELSIGAYTRNAPYATGSGTRTLAFRYQVQATDFDGDGISVGPDPLQRGRIEDGAGNDWQPNLPGRRIQPLPQQADHKVDGRASQPAVISVGFLSSPASSANGYYTEGDMVEVYLRFNMVVFVTEPDGDELQLILAIGEHSRNATYANGSGTRILTFRYAVQNGDLDDEGISIGPGTGSLVGARIESAGGVVATRGFRGIAADSSHKVDAVPLSATRTTITSRSSDGTYGLGEIIEVEVALDEAAFVTEAGDEQLELVLGIGAESPRAEFVDGSGSAMLRFRYIVRQGDFDEDGISIGARSLVGAVIEDRAGNEWADDARRIPPVDPQSDQKVDAGEDGVAPRITSLDIVSTPTDGETFKLSESIRVDVEFSEVVFVTGQPTVALSIGATVRNAAFVSGGGTDTLVFSYVVQQDDFDDDGISIGPGALAGGTIVDAGGNETLRDSHPSPAEENAEVNGGGDPEAPAIVDVRIKPPTHDAYDADDAIDVEITFNDIVRVTGQPQPMLSLSIGTASKQAAYFTGSGTRTLTFRYVVQSGDHDNDGISIAAGPSSLVGGTIQDDAGNDARRTFRALGADPRYRVVADSTPPTVERVRIASSVDEDEDAYGIGDAIVVEITFSEVVHVTGQSTLALSIGAATRQATFHAGSGTEKLRFRYVVQAGDHDDDGISIGAGSSSLTGGAIQDSVGNDALRTFDALPADRLHRVSVNLTMPAVDNVSIASFPADLASYRAGQEIDINIAFTEIVHVTGQPTLVLSIGTAVKQAAFLTGSGTNVLKFRYVVQTGDYDADGISIGAGPGSLTGGTIQDGAGNDAARAFSALDADPNHKVDARRPAITIRDVRFRSTPADPEAGVYLSGEAIEVSVAFSERVHVTGQPMLVLSIGTASRQAAFAAGSGTSELTFRYVVQAGDYDADGISIGAGPGSLTGGTIQDGAGNDAPRAFSALDADPNHKVDARRPVVGNVRFSSTPADPEAGVYLSGEAIEVSVAFSEQVHVTGQPMLVLSIGAESRQAAFATGSGTSELTFRYVVQVGDYDADGISIGAGPGSLTGGTIQDGAGNDAARAFSALDADPNHKVDARRPVVRNVRFSSTPASGIYLPGETILVSVAFSERVHVTGQPVLALSIGAESRQAAFATGSGTSELTFRYVVQVGDYDVDGISIGAGPDSLTGGTIQDRSGNDALRDFEAKAADPAQRVGIASLPAQPVRTLTVGKTESIDLAEIFGLPIPFHCVDPCTDNANVATATVVRSVLTIEPLAEGTASITIAAYGQISVEFPVVVQADAAEVAVLEHALAAIARGMLSGASNTLGARLESTHHQAGASIGGRRVPTTPWPRYHQRWAQHAATGVGAPAMHSPRSTFNAMAADLPRQQGVDLDRLLDGSSFEMSLIANRDTKWAVWGAGDIHAFKGKPKSGSYDGDLNSAYLGVDVQGEGWIAGAAVSFNSAEADYDFTSSLSHGRGRVETTLTVLHPYVQWSLGQRGRMWAIVGVGVGEASFVRDSAQTVKPEPSDLTLRMGLVGIRSELLQFDDFELALRGDAGIASLETDNGPTALDGLAVSAQRVRVGVEAAYVLGTTGGGTFKPFLDVGGRFDGGDGQTGFGVELAAGVRYRSATVGFEAKARTLAMHAADDYSETGASAMLMVTPGTGGKGLRFSLAPRWGGLAESQDMFWSQAHVFQGSRENNELRRGRNKWGMAARLGYGFGLRQTEGAVSPFVEYDLTQHDQQETRFGIGYKAESAKRLQFDVSGAQVENQQGTEQRWLLTLQGRL